MQADGRGGGGKEPNKTTAKKASASFILFFFFCEGVHENALNYVLNSLLYLHYSSLIRLLPKMFFYDCFFNHGIASPVDKTNMRKISVENRRAFLKFPMQQTGGQKV